MTTTEHKGFAVENVAKGKADWYLFTDLCKGCGLCIEKCPLKQSGCLNWSKEVGIYQTPAVEPNPEICTACGMCATVCPDSAIKIVRK